jgi:hypothetical protein
MRKQRHCEEILNRCLPMAIGTGMDDVAISYFRLKPKGTFNNW